MRKRNVTLALFAVLLFLLMPLPAQAHAGLVRSVPAIGETLDSPPGEVLLELNEDLDANFSSVRLLDANNQEVAPGPGTIDPTNARILRLPLPLLEKGSYTAMFKLRSSVDGHTTEGAIPFGVGVVVTTSFLPPPGTPEPAMSLPVPQDALARWLNYLFAALAFGSLPFALFVWRPSYQAVRRERQRPEQAVADAVLTRAMRWTTTVGGVLFVLANLFFLLTQAAAGAGVSLTQAFGAPLFGLVATRTGMLVLVRVALAALIVALTVRLPLAGAGKAQPWWAALVLAGTALLTISLGSHGAASEQPLLAVPLDWMHLAAMVAWLGGLVPLVVAIGLGREGEKGVALRDLIPRFSQLALLAVGILIATGSYSAWLHIGRLDIIDRTTYGQAFALKMLAFTALLVLGYVNLRRLTPRLRQRGNHTAPAFGRTTRIELVIGALALLCVGVMTSVAPSRVAWREQERLGIAQTASTADVDLTLRVAPAVIGDNELAVDVTDRRPGTAGTPAKVLFNFGMEGMQMGELQTEATTNSGERYVTRGNYLSMGGRWQIEVVFRRVGQPDVRHTFTMDIVRAATSAP